MEYNHSNFNECMFYISRFIPNTISIYIKQEVNLDGYKLKRAVDGKRDYIYNFRNFALKPGKSVKVIPYSMLLLVKSLKYYVQICFKVKV